jgi:hypothetical protein
MNYQRKFGSQELLAKLKVLAEDIATLATEHQGEIIDLLAILRSLEQSHRQVREEWFQDALPSNRQVLYSLLRDIEESGGWPYIERGTVRSLLSQLREEQVHNQVHNQGDNQKEAQGQNQELDS